MGKIIFFYANNKLMGSARLNAYSAKYIIRNMNIISTKIWTYEWSQLN